MATITLRSIKGSPLTIAEVDQNFSNLNIEVGQKLDSASYTAADVLNKLKTVDTDTSGLNATTLKSMDPVSTNTNNSIVMRDVSGSFAANNITANNFIGNVTGNVSGTSLNVTGTVAVINGGTGANSPSAALDNLLPSGEVAGYVLKTSGPGTYYWALETGATTLVGTRINTSRVIYTATAGQTLFTGIGPYTIGAGQLRVYVNGVRLLPESYTETSTTTFTLASGVPVGTKVMAEIDAFISYDIIANAVTFSPTGNVSSTNVQNAIAELDTEKAPKDSPTFTGTVSGISAAMVGLGNVTNESKATMFTNAALTGVPTAPTAAAGTSTTQIATTAFVNSNFTGSNQSLTSTGYQKLPGGLIIQWGNSPQSNNGGPYTVTFPIAFPNTCFTVNLTIGTLNTDTSNSVSVGSITTTSFQFYSVGGGPTYNHYWVAIGY